MPYDIEKNTKIDKKNENKLDKSKNDIVENKDTGKEYHTNEPHKLEKLHDEFKHMKEKHDEHSARLDEHDEHLKDLHNLLTNPQTKENHDDEIKEGMKARQRG